MDMKRHAIDSERAGAGRHAIWFEQDPASGAGHTRRPPCGTPSPRSWLVGQGAGHSEDGRLLALIEGLGTGDSASTGAFRAGILDKDGSVYRVVRLYCTYEAMVFTARMHALGFRQVRAIAAQDDCDVAFYGP
jgi:hypothetical protein